MVRRYSQWKAHAKSLGQMNLVKFIMQRRALNYLQVGEAKMWIDSFINNTEPLVKPEEALVVTEILEAIYESGRTGKAVNFEKKA